MWTTSVHEKSIYFIDLMPPCCIDIFFNFFEIFRNDILPSAKTNEIMEMSSWCIRNIIDVFVL